MPPRLWWTTGWPARSGPARRSCGLKLLPAVLAVGGAVAAPLVLRRRDGVHSPER
ncbi:DUF5957 family protein [Saccharopolyspora erythraea]|uniref:DUF5957 family protein n=1 Tax=Saccharopolyspora erythraea TaxID=1836 RepID=UPI003556E798